MRPTSKLLSLHGEAYRPPQRTLLEHLGLLCLLGLAIVSILSVEISAQGLKEGDTVVTITDAFWVKVRSNPEVKPDNVITKVPGGFQLRTLGSENGWYQVQLPEGSTGWVNADYAVEDYARAQLEVVSSAARLRAEGNTASPQVAKVPELTRLHILGEQGDWYNVLAPYGERGWIREDLVVLRPVDPSGPTPQTAELATDPTARATESLLAGVNMPEPTSTLEESPLLPTEPKTDRARQAHPPQSTWVPKKPQALLVSFVVGVSLFIVLTLIGTLILFQRNLSQIESKLPPDQETMTEVQIPAVAGEVAVLAEATEKDIKDLDKSIDECLQSLRETAVPSNGDASDDSELAETVQRQQQQILQYLELIALQNQKLKTYHRETESVRSMVRKLSSGPTSQRTIPSSYSIQPGKLSILPA